ncbi:MAG: hypothetical protein GEU78_14440 [Actinobacteria bacterium]|nr:hypothetical protein [Actinomycetota bacterium]
MRPLIADGWLKVKYDGPELARIFIAVTRHVRPADHEWRPAFLDWHKNQRVAQVRAADRGAVWLWVDEGVARVGNVR